MALSAINLIRLVQSLIRFTHYKQNFKTKMESTICISPNADGSVSVLKQFPTTNYKMLRKVYAALSKANECPYIPVFITKPAFVTKPGSDILTRTWEVETSSVGKEVLPVNKVELLWAIWCVLQALRVMHSEGFYHCDIRWPNILQSRRPDRWMLIDWDQACTAGQDIEYLKAAPENNPISGAEADIWMVGNLVNDKNLSSELTQDPGVQRFSSWLSAQPTAEAALSHEWLTTPRFDDPLWQTPASRLPEIYKLLPQALSM